MDVDLIEELRKRDELLAGYLKQIEIQEEFIQKQKEMIEYLEDHISKITDIISGVWFELYWRELYAWCLWLQYAHV